MHESTRKTKEVRYLDAAEVVFAKLGFQNTTMDQVAKEGGCSKPTLYKYFESKENLYMAITYRAFTKLVAAMRETVSGQPDSNGLKTSVDLFLTYQQFSEEHFFYHQLLLEHLNFIRAISNDQDHPWLTEAMRKSPFLEEVQVLQNEPLAISVEQIMKGQEDGSIENKRNPVELYLTAWAFIIGFTKISSIASGSMHHYPMQDWKEHVYDQVERYLKFGTL